MKHQSYARQVKDFVDDTRLNGVSLVYGIKLDTVSSTVTLPRKSNSTVFFGAQTSTEREDPIAGLTGTEKFTISVTENSVTENVAVDLANVTGPLNVDSIVSEINAQLIASLVDTAFIVERFSETSYGFRVNVGRDETVSFSADAATESSAVYVAGSAGRAIPRAASWPSSTISTPRIPTNRSAKRSTRLARPTRAPGSPYVVGTTAGNLDDQINTGGNDVYLTKFDAAGNEIYTRLLGSAEDASGFAVAVDSGDNVIVAGQMAGPLTDIAFGGGYDAFVTKFDSAGQETFTRQVSPFASDGALALTVDSSDNIVLAGFTQGAIDSTQTFGGSSDAFVTKLDSSGTLIANRQFGDSGTEVATAVAVNAAGDVFVVGTDDGNGFLRRYDAADSSLAYTLDLGSLGADGDVTGIAVDSNGDLLISGISTNAALSGTVKNAHSGGLDAFVLAVDDQTTSATTSFVTYAGTSGTDRGFGVAVDTSDNSFYLTGKTNSTFAGETKSGAEDAFITKFDSAGNLAYTHQFGGAFNYTGTAIAFDSNGTSVLSRLGLPSGAAPGDSASTVIAETSVRPGQFFSISIEGGANRRITVEDDDSFGFLAFRINSVLGDKGKASFVEDIDGQHLEIKALNGATFEILAGAEGRDALAGLGLRETKLFGEPADLSEVDADSSSAFELGFIDGLNVLSRATAAEAEAILDGALLAIEKAYRFLTGEPEKKTSISGTVSARTLSQIANFKAALARLESASAAGFPPIINIFG